jgi:type IV pilus assembly protein PilM
MNFDPIAMMMLSSQEDLFGRRPAAREPWRAGRGAAAPDARTSIWKREISLRRRHDDAEPEPVVLEAASEPEPESEKRPSIWKRDISFRRRHDDSEAKAVELEPELEAEPEREARPSVWKRDISFRRRHDDPEAEAVEPEPDPEPEPAAAADPEPEPEREKRPSIWKRDISFRHHPAEPEPELAPEPEHAPEPQAETPPATLSLPPLPAASVPDWSFEEPAAAEPQPETVWRPAEEAPVSSIWDELGMPDPAESYATEPVPEPEPESIEIAAVEPPALTVEPPVRAVESPLPEVAETQPPETRKRRRLGRRRAQEQNAASPAAAPEKKHATRGGSKRAVKIVGLNLGASQIAAAYVRNNGCVEVLKVARTPLARGIVVAGELRDPDLLADALRTFFKANKLPKRGVRLGIGSNRVGVRVLEVAGVEDTSLLANAVRFRAQEVLPMPLTEAVLDYRVLSEEVDAETGEVNRRVLVAFAYRELVNAYVAACRKAGIKLTGIDLEGFALLRALVDPAESSTRPAGAAVVTASLGHDRSIMSVSDGTTCEFTRVLEWGGGALDTAVARILALTPSQAEPLKRALTLDRAAAAPEGLSPEQASRARGAMLQEVNAFAREFVSSLTFYQAQPGSLDIGEIVVTGGTAHMPGLVDELQRLIGVGVRLGDPLGRVKVGKQLRGEQPMGSLALAIGLGIED